MYNIAIYVCNCGELLDTCDHILHIYAAMNPLLIYSCILIILRYITMEPCMMHMSLFISYFLLQYATIGTCIEGYVYVQYYLMLYHQNSYNDYSLLASYMVTWCLDIRTSTCFNGMIQLPFPHLMFKCFSLLKLVLSATTFLFQPVASEQLM